MKWLLVYLLCCAEASLANGNAAADMLARAARLGDLKALESLLSLSMNADSRDTNGHTPLYYAVAFNQTTAVALLLACHADPNTRVSINSITPQPPETPLQSAAELGNKHVASLLIAAGARINEKGPAGRTALHYARGQLHVLQLLIEKGADVNSRDEDGASPLDDAAWYDSLDTVAILLAHGARLNESEPKTGATPRLQAPRCGRV